LKLLDILIKDLARPGLHEFMSKVYQDYDIVIWSQTSWKWLVGLLLPFQQIIF